MWATVPRFLVGYGRVEWWEPFAWPCMPSGLLSFPLVGGSVWVGCMFIWPSKLEGSCCVRYGSSVSQFSDWDKTAVSHGELGCLSQMSSCV
jgi:hypothetical protein